MKSIRQRRPRRVGIKAERLTKRPEGKGPAGVVGEQPVDRVAQEVFVGAVVVSENVDRVLEDGSAQFVLPNPADAPVGEKPVEGVAHVGSMVGTTAKAPVADARVEFAAGTEVPQHKPQPSKRKRGKKMDEPPVETLPPAPEAPVVEPAPHPLTTGVIASLDVETLLIKAVEHGVSIDTMERLLALREKLRAEAAREAFLIAFANFQLECPVIPKTKTAQMGTYTYHYAPLEVCEATMRPVLHKYGLSYRFETKLEYEPRIAQTATCTLSHVAGHSESSRFEAPIDPGAKMNDMQKSASAQTYAKRYALLNVTGRATGDDDDDGNSVKKDGNGKFKPPTRTVTVETPPPPPPPPAAKEDDLESKLKASVDEQTILKNRPAGSISEPQYRLLMGRLRELAKVAGGSFDELRDYMHQIAREEYKAEHIAWIAAKEFELLLKRLDQAIEKERRLKKGNGQ